MKKFVLFCSLCLCLHAFGQKNKPEYVQFPEYPSYKSVIKQFLKKYRTPEIVYPQQFCFTKKPDGWHAMVIQRWPEYKEYKDELFWTRSFNAFLDIGFEKLDEIIDKPMVPRQMVDPEDSMCTQIFPFWGYMGWENDIIEEYKNVSGLSDDLLNALARAYSSYASNLLSNTSGFSDPEIRFNIPAGQNALSGQQLQKFLEYEHKAIETYKKLRIQNSAYETYVGNINLVYSNEILNSFLTLRYYQNNEEARRELKPKLYDPFFIALAKNYLASCDSNAILFTNGDLDTYPVLYVQETEGIRKDVLVVNINLLNSERYVNHLFQKVGKAVPLNVCLSQDMYRSGKKDIIYILKRDSMHTFYDLKTLIENVGSKDISKKYHGREGYLDYFPGTTVEMKVNKTNVLNYKIVAGNDKDSIEPVMRWNLGAERTSLLINNFIILDVLSCSDFKRPIYFSNTTVPENFLGLEKYFESTGLAYKVVPVASKNTTENIGRINAENLYTRMMHGFHFAKIEVGSGFRYTNSHIRQICNYRSQFCRLSKALIKENKKTEARRVLEYCDQQFPSSIARHNSFSIGLIECYYMIGDKSKGNGIAREMFENYSIEADKMIASGKFDGNLQLTMNVLYDLSNLTNKSYPQGKFGHNILEKYSELYRKVSLLSQQGSVQK